MQVQPLLVVTSDCVATRDHSSRLRTAATGATQATCALASLEASMEVTLATLTAPHASR